MFKYTVQRPGFLDAHFDDINEVSGYIEEILAKGGTYKFIKNVEAPVQAPAVAPKQAPAASKPVVKKVHYCASCKHGEVKTEADVYVQGRIESGNGKMIPYRAYLCAEHYELMGDCGNDGKLRVRKV